MKLRFTTLDTAIGTTGGEMLLSNIAYRHIHQHVRPLIGPIRVAVRQGAAE